MGLTKAKIKVLDQKGAEKETVEVMFNPNEYSLEMGNKYSWHNLPGLSSPVGQFISGEAASLTMDLFFDTHFEDETKKDVRDFTSKITGLLDVDKDQHAPPLCEFAWGTLSFKGVVEKVAQKFTMFLESGTPVRATLTVTFRKWATVTEQFQQIPRQSADRTKQRTIKQGEQLWMVAGQEYDDPGLWREIAEANGIDNPRLLEPGRQIIVPPLE